MDNNSDAHVAEPSEYIRQISRYITVYSRVFIGAGLFAIAGALLLHDFKIAGAFGLGGIVSLGAGSILAIVARQFGRRRRWTYPVVRVLVGTLWGFNTAFLDGYPNKIQNAEVRRAFGLGPLPGKEERNGQGRDT